MTADTSLRLKAGQTIRGLAPEVLTRLTLHPLQRAAVGRIDELLGWLDACASPEDMYEFQRHLFSAVFEVETRRSACSRAAKRIRRGKAVQGDAPTLPDGADPSDVTMWEFEVFVCARLARQMRCVGDGLAWKAYRHDRRFIMALARNSPAGLLVGKEGLGYELGRVQELWRDRKHFGLLHDLTNCLRIADITEFTLDRGALLHEVKKSRRISPTQKARAQAVIDAIMHGGVLPGGISDARFLMLATRFRADMGPLRDAIGLARARGTQGVSLREGRMLYVASIWDAMRNVDGDIERAIDSLAAERAAAIRRAGIDRATHHLVGNSGDTAGRSPTAAPLSIFPLDPADRADLICDLVTFETVVSVDALAKMLGDRGLQVEVLYPERSQEVPQDTDVMQIAYRDRRMTIHAPAMNPLMFELLRPSAWCDAMAESLALDAPPGIPVVVLSGEATIWR